MDQGLERGLASRPERGGGLGSGVIRKGGLGRSGARGGRHGSAGEATKEEVEANARSRSVRPPDEQRMKELLSETCRYMYIITQESAESDVFHTTCIYSCRIYDLAENVQMRINISLLK